MTSRTLSRHRITLAMRAALMLICSLVCSVASAQALPNGGSVSSSITTPGQKKTYTFRATAGEGYQLRLVDVNANGFYPTISVVDPSGTTLHTDADHDVAALGRAAPRTGVYRVVVGGGTTSTGTFRLYFTLAPGANAGGKLPNGGVVSGSISRGDLDSYTFSIGAGESYQLRLSDTNTTGLYIRMIVYGPSGNFVHQDADHNVAALGGAAAHSGTYTVIVCDGNSSPAATGAYNLHFVGAPGANAGGSLPNGGIISGAIRLGEIDSYTFNITAGQSYQLRLSDTNRTGLYIRLLVYDPRGCLVHQDADHNVAALGKTAQFTGTYTVIACDGNSSPAATGGYTLHYVRAPGANAGGSLPSGGSVAGTIDQGDLDSYTFSIDAGQSYLLRFTDSNSTGLYARILLYDPRGAFVAQDADHEVAGLGDVAGVSGTYTVIVCDGNSSPAATGTYRLHYAKIPSANAGGPLRNSGSLSGKIQKGEIESFTFSIDAGQSYIIRVVDSQATGLYLRALVYDPRGTFVAQDAGHHAASVSGAAKFSGTYTAIIMDGNSSPAATGDFEVHFTKIPGANEGGFLLDGVRASQTIDRGDLDSFTFRARAGDVIKITLTDSNASSLYPAFNLYGPSGAFINRAAAATTATLNYTIARDGTHTIVVYDGTSSQAATGNYTLDLDGSGYVGNSGCDREGPVLLSGAISARTGFTFTAPSFTTRPCTGPKIVVFGSCGSNPILLPSTVSCGSCGLLVSATWGTGIDQITIPPLPAATVGLSFCVQSGCQAGSCLTLSAGTHLTIVR